MFLRASFNGPDPTLRIVIAIINVVATPARNAPPGFFALHHQDGTPIGTCLGVYTAEGLWKVITERKPEQSILSALKAAAQISEAA